MITFYNRNYIFYKIDWILVVIYLIMVIWGWSNIFASEYSGGAIRLFDFSTDYSKQFFWILVSVSCAFFILLFDVRFFPAFSYVLYFLIIVVLLLVLGFGQTISGSKSWLIITDTIRLQPSEFGKVAVALTLAKLMNSQNFSLKTIKHNFYALAIVALPTLLILLQNDAGTAIVFFAFLLVFYRMGWPAIYYLLALWVIMIFSVTILFHYVIVGIALTVITLSLIWFIRKNKKAILLIFGVLFVSIMFSYSVDYIFKEILLPHQKDRIVILFGQKTDPLGVGYNINQSLIAIGSGGVTGKGFMNGTQTKFDFVPEQKTDFIFCTIGEEWGFIGSSILIILFVCLLIRIVLLAEKQRAVYSMIFGYSVASVFFIHFFINIGMTINLLPVIGIPLPFFSYGGSSMLAFTFMLFIFIKLNTRKDVLL